MTGSTSSLNIYIASSFRNIHTVRLLTAALEEAGHVVLDWTTRATPPKDLSVKEQLRWMDSHDAKEVFAFCSSACGCADLVLYLGESGQDTGVEIGMAWAAGVPVLGILGPFEEPGLMLSGAVSAWVDMEELLRNLPAVSSFLQVGRQGNAA